MNANTKSVRATAQMKLSQRLNGDVTALTTEDIRKVITDAVAFFGCNDVDVDALVADLETAFQTWIGSERTLQGHDEAWEPWLDKGKAQIEWRFWRRYEQYLLQEQEWPQATLDRLDASTDQVLGLLTDPQRPGGWDRRGMVVGHVQSGKTGHYVGLISKAADAGYKLIVVLAGFHNSLRSQTQIRLEEGFLGHDRSANPADPGKPARRIGVGLIDPLPVAGTITTRNDDGDFKRQVARNFAISPGGQPLLFVIKKNGSVLRNLLGWVQFFASAKDEEGRPYVRDVPLLVIDDEADQGSIDTKKGVIDPKGKADADHDPTLINKSVRKLLHLFEKSAYVGYTATPFANIFIHERGWTKREGEDLFPRSSIVSLPTPSSYVGPAEVFGIEDEEGERTAGLPIIRHVEDHADTLELHENRGWMPPKHRIDHVPRFEGRNTLPDSLIEAVHAFILVCAARLARGQGDRHNSMLVHVTRFTLVQERVFQQIEAELINIQRRLRYGDGEGRDSILSELRELWEADFEKTTSRVSASHPSYGALKLSWDDVCPFITPAATSIGVRQINGLAGEVLDYVQHQEKGLNVIAVGGDKLSRGLTLEGLSVSYFLRASRMYDTLMQMGRWFGYRPGYLDLCRLYTTTDLSEWYALIAAASEELRHDFNRMAASGGTPRDYGLRVRSHPALLVTSQVKMRSGTKIDVTFAADISETINFWRDRAHLEQNWKAAQALIERIAAAGFGEEHAAGHGGTPRMWKNVPYSAVVDFLGAYQEHEASRKVKTKLLADYIRAEVKEARLTRWTVLIAGGSSKRTGTLGPAAFKLVERSWHLPATTNPQKDREELQKANHYRIRRLVSPADEAVDLTEEERKRALDATIREWEKDPRGRKRPEMPSGAEIRRVRQSTCGLLILYPLDPHDSDNKEAESGKVEEDARTQPVLGFAISFPDVPELQRSKVRYVVGNVYYEQEFGAGSESAEEYE
jgi:hypothetical protein